MIPKTEKQRKKQANFTPENGKKINQTKQTKHKIESEKLLHQFGELMITIYIRKRLYINRFSLITKN